MAEQLSDGSIFSSLSVVLESPAEPRTGPATDEGGMRVTQGQLQAVAMRCREELAISLRRTGTDTVAMLKKNVLTVRVEHSLAAAEQQLMRRSEGRAFFQRYIEELAEQIHPDLKRHVEHILPYSVTYVRVVVDCDNDCILFHFGLYRGPVGRDWSKSVNRRQAIVNSHDRLMNYTLIFYGNNVNIDIN